MIKFWYFYLTHSVVQSSHTILSDYAILCYVFALSEFSYTIFFFKKACARKYTGKIIDKDALKEKITFDSMKYLSNGMNTLIPHRFDRFLREHGLMFW